jgi:hypothetical protein
MAIVVNAGGYVQATIRLQNIGQQAGTFRIRAVVVPDGAGVDNIVQRFYASSGYSTVNPPPAGADTVATPSVAPNAEATVIMYTNMWADGDPLRYSSQQIFDIIFEVVVVETGEVFNFRGENILQHQTLAPARPEVVGVDYNISAQTGYSPFYYQ